MNFIEKWLRTEILKIKPYQVAKANNMIKLDAMESPFTLSANLRHQYLNYLADADINRYPDAGAHKVKQRLREFMQIPPNLDILLGNGSDELIQTLALACNTNDTILSFNPSFVMYQMIAKFTRLNYHSIELNNDFDIDLEKTQAAIQQLKPKLIFIAYPNNPTGNLFSRTTITKIIQNTDALVVLDEAYYAYTNDSFLTDIDNYQNLVIIRTISKIGFAGLRLGVLIGNSDTITQLDKLRLPYNINSLTQISTDFLLQEQNEIHANINAIISQREYLLSELSAIDKLQIYPSQTNFILFKVANAEQLFTSLINAKILIKNFLTTPSMVNYLRVSVGSVKENKIFITAVKQHYDNK